MPVALLIAGLTVHTVLRQSKALSVRKLFGALGSASPLWLSLTFLCMLGFIVWEGLSFYSILRRLGHARGFLHCLLYSSGDQFFSAITPSATGGQPASALFMSAHGIPGAVVAFALLLNLILYTLATLLLGAVCLVLRPDLLLRLNSPSRALIVFGMIALSGLCVLFWVLLKKGDIFRRCGARLLRFLHALHLIRDIGLWEGKLSDTVVEYRKCADVVSNNPGLLRGAFLCNLCQRLAQTGITLTLHCALGGILGARGLDLWAVQVFSLIGSYCVPIPGGMGAVDYLMLDGFRLLFQGDYVYELQTLSRGISFYLCTLLSGVITLVGHTALRLSQKEKKG